MGRVATPTLNWWPLNRRGRFSSFADERVR